ncbi:MAG: AMP-binding protein [Aquabacterium sp.]
MTDSVAGLIRAQAAARPQAVFALATGTGRAITYRALADSAAGTALALRQRGVAPGATVALVMPNGLATLELLLGAMAAGVAVNPVNLLSAADAMGYVLDHSDCALVFAAPDWADRVRALVAGLVRPVAVVEIDPDAPLPWAAEPPGSGAATMPTDPASAAPPPDTGGTALLMYTSGTTGRPKGVMLTQANLVANARAIAAEHALGPDDRVLGVLPLYHINAFAVTMLAPLASGGSVAMAPRFSAGQFWRQALDSGCTWINLVPTMVSYLLEADAPPPQARERIRFARSASAALPPEHLQGFEQRFGIGVIETMGLTETVAPAFSNPLAAGQRKLGSVGRASGGEARIIGPDLQPLPDGQTGELAIRGPHVMRGYFKDPAATAAAFTPDSWLRTGDLGHRDGDGFFFVTGRIKELVIKGGENIAPREIDEALLRHPAVLEAGTVGIPDRHYGQELAACVVLREGHAADEAALRAHCERELGRYKTPRHIRIVADLPRGPSGKLQRLKLQGQFSDV